MGFNAAQFGATRRGWTSGRSSSPISFLRIGKMTIKNGRKYVEGGAQISMPAKAAEDISNKLRSSKVDYAIDKDGTVYVFAGNQCQLATHKGNSNTRAYISIHLIAEQLVKHYGDGKHVNVEYEVIHDSDGVPAVIFTPLGKEDK